MFLDASLNSAIALNLKKILHHYNSYQFGQAFGSGEKIIRIEIQSRRSALPWLVSADVERLIIDIALCIIAAWVVAVVGQLVKQPLLMAYLLAGFLIGPHGFKWVEDQHSIETISSIGLILLLFMIGLEMDLNKMFTAGKAITITAAAQIFGCIALGWLFFRIPGFGGTWLEAFYLAVAAAMSSTVIIVKILYDKHELETLAGRITLGVLVLQDLITIMFLAVQPNLKNPAVGILALAVGKFFCWWEWRMWRAVFCCRPFSNSWPGSRNWCWSARWRGVLPWRALRDSLSSQQRWARWSPA